MIPQIRNVRELMGIFFDCYYKTNFDSFIFKLVVVKSSNGNELSC